jgi:hypothetical protein
MNLGRWGFDDSPKHWESSSVYSRIPGTTQFSDEAISKTSYSSVIGPDGRRNSLILSHNLDAEYDHNRMMYNEAGEILYTKDGHQFAQRPDAQDLSMPVSQASHYGFMVSVRPHL